MSGVLTKKFGRKNSLAGPASSSTYSRSSHDEFFHVKYVYDWLKPAFARAYIRAGLVNASARNTTSGCSSRTVRMSHSQKPIGLVWGLSTRKIAHAALHPEHDGRAQLLPQRRPVVGLPKLTL